MREIKFRVYNGHKHISLCEAVREAYISFSCDITLPNELRSKCDDVIIEQYTGYTDLNGVEIYEGDVYEWKDPAADYHTIATRSLIAMDVECLWFLESYHGGVVIGNIHKNPELLGVVNE